VGESTVVAGATSEHADQPGADPVTPVGEQAAATDTAAKVDRRQLFRTLAGVTGLVGAGAVLAACDLVADTTDPAVHLARRASFGLTTPTLERLRALGAAGWLDEQLTPSQLNTGAVETKVAQLPLVGATYPELKAAAATNPAVGLQVQLATLIRQVESPAQLFERMVEFWSDHLNVPILDNRLGVLKTLEDRQVIRPHALGRFADLLVASAQSPAMLTYLDGASSVKAAPNENYGRELLELHTVGVGNYTEADVTDASRLFTGWAFDQNTGAFLFRPTRHDTGPVSILGWTRPATGSGLDHGVAFLQWLSRHPATARTIATKLARRFVADRPASDLVTAMADAYLASDTAIVPVLRTMFAHPSFASARNTKFRRPHDWFVAAARALRASITPATERVRIQRLGAVSVALGQYPFGWPAPNGYPDVEGAWLNAGGLLARWNVAGDLTANAVALVGVDTGWLRTGLDGKPASAALDTLAQRLLGEPLTAAGRTVLLDHAGVAGSTTLGPLQAASFVQNVVPLLLASPDLQYR
jgi:uncharacterized protein (DUF1800 family)